MDAARRARYLDKLAHADARLGLAEEWLGAARVSTKDRLAAYKAFQEAAEAATDLAAMAVADSGRVPKDDYMNLASCVELGLTSPALLPALRKAVGLRNRLVHEYNGIDDATALSSMEALAPKVREFLGGVERWLTSKR